MELIDPRGNPFILREEDCSPERKPEKYAIPSNDL
jgi:hypothetical protein